MNVIVTGASAGIGYELARYLSGFKEHKVVALARRADRLEQLKNEAGSDHNNLYTIPIDLVNDDLIQKFVPFVSKYCSSIDAVINNAGMLVTKEFEALTDSDFNTVFDANVKSIFRLTQALLPLMGNPSHIVNISSMGGVQGSAKFPGLSLYSASKGAVSILSECLAEEFKEKNISVNALAIGAVQTEMLEAAFPGYKAPLQPHEMAKYIGDFALNGHHFYNGKVLPVSVSTP